MYKSLTLSLVILLGSSLGSYAQLDTFNYTGGPGPAIWVVPPGVTSVFLDVQGAQGGIAGPVGVVGTTTPGCGGRVQGTIAVTAGQELLIRVGGAGANGNGTGNSAGGYNGGGLATLYSGPYNATGGGGGGQSDVSYGSALASVTEIIAGGGGGAGYNPICAPADQPGGNGGGLSGASVVISSSCSTALLFGAGYSIVRPSGGGTPAAGGIGGWLCCFGDVSGTTGGFASLAGGGAAPGAGGLNVLNGGVGGGGGAGYRGGGGGCWMGGGGGASYADPGIAGVVHTQGYNGAGCTATTAGGNGVVVLCAPVPGSIAGPSSVADCSTITLYDTTSSATGVWTSSNSAVATIDPTGIVYPASTTASGTTTISYTLNVPGCGSAYASTVVSVTSAPGAISGPTTLCMDPAGSPAPVNTITLTDATPGGGWLSGNPAVATVGLINGIVHPVATGPVVIQYQISGGCGVTTTINVVPATPAITGPSPAVLCVGDSVILSDPTLGGRWSSSLPIQVPIDSLTGKIHGVGAASNTITYTISPGCKTTFYVTVNASPIPFSPDSGKICKGRSMNIAQPIPNGIWGSTNPLVSVAFQIVAPFLGGDVLGLSPGNAYITYTKPGCGTDSFYIEVDSVPQPITGITVLCAGTPTALFDASPGGTWSSDNPAISIGSATGLVTGTIIGSTANIIYRIPGGTNGCVATIPVSVDTGVSPIIGPDSVCTGASTTLMDTSVGGTSAFGGIWTSSALAIAQVIATTGVVTGITAGTVNISYTVGTGCYATKTFTVSPLIPTTVSVAKYPPTTLCSGDSIMLVATSTNGGIMPAYKWDSFSVNIADSVDTIRLRPTHGDVVYITLNPRGVCAVHDTVIDTVPLNVYPMVAAPIITITLDTPLTTTGATLGETYIFHSSVIYGGVIQSYQWYKNALPIPGATSSYLSVPIYYPSTFYCNVSGNAPCDSFVTSDTSNHISIGATFVGVNTMPQGGDNLTLFPNPNTGMFTLSGMITNVSGKDIELEVTDMLGRIVYRGTTTPQSGVVSQQISLNGLATGSYLLRVNMESGTEVFRFVVAK